MHDLSQRKFFIFTLIAPLIFLLQIDTSFCQSKLVELSPTNNLIYHPDAKGNILPDFSKVGYKQGQEPPRVPVVKIIQAAKSGSSQSIIQNAIDEVSKLKPNKLGFRGALLLKKGTYKIEGTINIRTSGIVLRGEGEGVNDTHLIGTGTRQRNLINISGTGSFKRNLQLQSTITDSFVPVGRKYVTVNSTNNFKKGDSILLFRPGTQKWIHDLKMDQIQERKGTKQWIPTDYNLEYERVITKIEGNKIYLDNPVVMEMDAKYGGGAIYPYHFEGRINNIGIENMHLSSSYSSDTAENHAWVAIRMNKIENGWVQHVTSQYFGYSCVSLGTEARNISVLHANCFDAKSIITGSRRYSFNNDGQLNLFMDCHTTEGRHDFVTGAKVCGPNVFYNCTAKNTHADIGPHHRWATGTLYDNIHTTGEINIQDRGNWGSGHGWSGVTQILWNCSAKTAVVQDPWVSGHNYSIGLKGAIGEGRLKNRKQGIWIEQNNSNLQPSSLYLAQLRQRLKTLQ